jgi:predicted metal-dependent hydrolase
MQLDLPLTDPLADCFAPASQRPVPGTAHLVPSASPPALSTSHLAPPTVHLASVGTPPLVLRPLHSTLEFVRHPRARRYVIRVRSDGTVRVTIPRGGSKREGQDFARRQAPWVEKQRQRVAQENARPRQAISPVERAFIARAKIDLPPRLLELAAIHGLSVTRVSVRNQRWRWGSCSRSGHICLNWRLIQMPPSVRDYVMIHELMHLKRLDHSPHFWKLVAAACPDYDAARTWLRRHGRS